MSRPDHLFHADDVDVAPERVRDLHAEGAVQLVDVREGYEWEAGRIAGARHIELERLAAQAPTIDPGTPVVFYCRLGARSGLAANAFRRARLRGVFHGRRPRGLGAPRAPHRAR